MFYLHDQEKMIEYLDGAGFDVIVSETVPDEDKTWLDIYARKRD
jgi:hypothetical protein